MTVVIFQVVTGLIGLVSLFYKQYQANAPAREKEARNDEIQQIRQDIASGDVNAIESRIDLLCNDSKCDNTTREQSAEDIQGRISRL